MCKDSTARKALAAAESDVARLLAERVACHDGPFFDQQGHEAAISGIEVRLAVAENRKATCLADVRAEDAERAAVAADKRGNTMFLIGMAGIVMTAAKIIYDFLK